MLPWQGTISQGDEAGILTLLNVHASFLFLGTDLAAVGVGLRVRERRGQATVVALTAIERQQAREHMA